LKSKRFALKIRQSSAKNIADKKKQLALLEEHKIISEMVGGNLLNDIGKQANLLEKRLEKRPNML
jgi:hypothetical protein